MSTDLLDSRVRAWAQRASTDELTRKRMRDTDSAGGLTSAALLFAGLPAREVDQWLHVAQSTPVDIFGGPDLPTMVQRTVMYRIAGFTPHDAESWVNMSSRLDPLRAYLLHKQGWDGYLYARLGVIFPVGADLFDGRDESGVLLRWVNSTLAGPTVLLYALSGITLTEAQHRWEPVRVSDPARWEDTVFTLVSLRGHHL